MLKIRFKFLFIFILKIKVKNKFVPRGTLFFIICVCLKFNAIMLGRINNAPYAMKMYTTLLV